MPGKHNTAGFSEGRFVISLDFELFWGVRDLLTIEQYGEHILGVRKAIPAMLSLFSEYSINATFSTVGFLFARDRHELEKFLPAVKPGYTDTNLSPYGSFPDIGMNESDDPYHFGRSLLSMVAAQKQHEIGSHTFCHYYCLEPGQDLAQFEADMEAAVRIARANQLEIRSLVFPRNQFNESYLQACRQHGITCYRGNPVSALYTARDGQSESAARRALRLLDAYVNISGHNCHSKEYILSSVIPNIAASRFLRPYSSRLAFADGLRLHRIRSGMTHAAKENKLFHLWWHPHNFGNDLEQNINFLEKLLRHYSALRQRYGFRSQTMASLAAELNPDHG
ncbi:MAG: polysaccharide deacetylase [Chitinophagaceae bacterium]|nr:MAG: polysaccharide deacetylase [Chitinophagaceae bacterium]